MTFVNKLTSCYGSSRANNGKGACALDTPSFPSPFRTALSSSPLSPEVMRIGTRERIRADSLTRTNTH
eukprot:3920762-Pyramimonas_sp.AAC.1